MILETLFEAAGKILECLNNPEFENVYVGDLRIRIEQLVIEMEAICTLPGIEPPPDQETLDLRAEALEEWYWERNRLQEDEQAEVKTEAIKHVKPMADDCDRDVEPEDDQLPD